MPISPDNTMATVTVMRRSVVPSASATKTSSNTEPALLSIVESLVSTYYPTSLISSLETELLPSTLVIGSSTITLYSEASTTGSAQSSHKTSDRTTTPTTSSALSSSSNQTTSATVKKLPSSAETNPATTRSSTKISSASSTATAATASTTGATSQDRTGSSGHSGDNKLGIVLGVLFGVIALILIALVIWFLCRRKRRHGSYFRRRDDSPLPSAEESRRDSWSGWVAPEPPGFSNTAYMGAASSPGMFRNEDRYTPAPASAVRVPPAMSTHPMFRRQGSSNSMSESRPLVDAAAAQGMTATGSPGHQELDGESVWAGAGGIVRNQQSDLLSNHNHHRRTLSGQSSNGSLAARTPFPPAGQVTDHRNWPVQPSQQQMQQQQRQQLQLQQQRLRQQQFQQRAPFRNGPYSRTRTSAEEEDEDYNDEARDLVSPIVSVRSVDRLRSPVVHYPSWEEGAAGGTVNSNGIGGGGGGGAQQVRWSG